MRKRRALFLLLMTLSLLLSACAGLPTPLPLPTATPSPEPTATPAPTATPLPAPEGPPIVSRGPTPIGDGNATSPSDITLQNEYLVVSLAVESPPPYGIPKGILVDAAPAGDVPDSLTQFSFILDGWGQWPEYDDVQILENTPERGVVQLKGSWKGVDVTTTYTLERDWHYVHVVNEVVNNTEEAFEGITSGYGMTLSRGWAFTPGFGTDTHYAADPKADVGAIGNWTTGYFKDFVFGLYAPFYTHLSTSVSWVDPFTIHTLEPGAEKRFEAYFQIEPAGETARVLELVKTLEGEPLGTVEGTVQIQAGSAVEQPVVVAKTGDGRPYAWAVGSEGRFTLKLPPGEYTLYATAAGYQASDEKSVTVSADTATTLDFTSLRSPGRVSVKVSNAETGDPMDAQIRVRGGIDPLVKYISTETVYTDLENVGTAEFDIAPGTYTFAVSAGGGYLSQPVSREVTVEPEAAVDVAVEVVQQFTPSDWGWYSADLHHHSLAAEATTPPKDVVRAQLAAGLDFTSVTDHNSVAYHDEMKKWSDLREILFLPSVEVTTNWAHFNPYVLPLGQDVLYAGTASEIFASLREAGAGLIQVNHPYYSGGGYFLNWDEEIIPIPGGYDAGWDTAEINGEWGDEDQRTFEKLWGFWNEGVTKYLSAGSDVHDVWATPFSGSPRLYVSLPEEQTPDAYVAGAKRGNSYVTYGPLFLPDQLFGETVQVDGIFELTGQVVAVDGVKKIEVVSSGNVVRSRGFLGSQSVVAYDFDFLPQEDTWFSLVVQDSDGDRAIANPVWVDVP